MKYIQLDGGLAPQNRGVLVEKFQTDSSIRICLLSLHAAAEGITLTAANKIFHLDPCILIDRVQNLCSRVEPCKNIPSQFTSLSYWANKASECSASTC